jgi:hypothetical protein
VPPRVPYIFFIYAIYALLAAACSGSHDLSDDPSDGNGDDDGDGYTNLEQYLNELAVPAFNYTP